MQIYNTTSFCPKSLAATHIWMLKEMVYQVLHIVYLKPDVPMDITDSNSCQSVGGTVEKNQAVL